MACYRLVIPHRATRAGAAGEKSSKNFGELFFLFFTTWRFEFLMCISIHSFGHDAIEISEQE